MTESLSERRLAENQVLFRQNNQQVHKNLEKLRKTAEAEGRDSLLPDIDMPLHFYCECSDENCRQRIILKPSEYKALHKNNKQFVLIPGHSVVSIERITKESDKYIVVEKYETPPKSSSKLNITNIDNA